MPIDPMTLEGKPRAFDGRGSRALSMMIQFPDHSHADARRHDEFDGVFPGTTPWTAPTAVHGIGPLMADFDDPVRQAFETALALTLPPPIGKDDVIAKAMADSLMSPGKRLRPLLLIHCAVALGAPTRAVMNAACALEHLHAASLVLDDLPCMDDALLRRGLPTLHTRYGEDVASLAVVALLSRAFGLVAAPCGLPESARNRMVAMLAEAVGHQGLVSGQMHDLRAGDDAGTRVDAETVNDMKTGALFCAALGMAAIAADATAQARRALLQCGVHIGQAFQLIDDLKDAGHLPCIGKATHLDDGKRTLLSVLGRDGAFDKVAHHAGLIVQLLSEALPDPRPVLKLLWPILRVNRRESIKEQPTDRPIGSYLTRQSQALT